MKDLNTQFREQSEHLTITPHASTWDRIDTKLRAHRTSRKLFFARSLNIAAAVFILLAAGVGIMLYSQQKSLVSNKSYTAHIAELRSPATSESIYDLSSIRRSWADLAVTHN